VCGAPARDLTKRGGIPYENGGAVVFVCRSNDQNAAPATTAATVAGIPPINPAGRVGLAGSNAVDAAGNAFTKALALRSDLPESLNGRGDVWAQAEKWQEAFDGQVDDYNLAGGLCLAAFEAALRLFEERRAPIYEAVAFRNSSTLIGGKFRGQYSFPESLKRCS
jgi:hypothetical protein